LASWLPHAFLGSIASQSKRGFERANRAHESKVTIITAHRLKPTLNGALGAEQSVCSAFAMRCYPDHSTDEKWQWRQSSANLSPLGDFPVKRENTGNDRCFSLKDRDGWLFSAP